ncbi:Rha family transcriptional regulator [Leucobacter sp. NPDC077196]|uniref:Rha family transcriptional regulator n=1 Tax=Leucobacter sp. NPDC077196 TaxID=3154959 RepID=UPI003417BB52
MSEQQAINIVEDPDGELRVSSLIIAGRTENQHASVLRIIRDRSQELEQFGLVRFEIVPRSAGQHGGGETTFALLNEPQSTLLMTFMRNSPVVLSFKVELVKQFYAMRHALSKPRPAAELDRRQLALMVIEAEDAREAAEQRALAESHRAAVAEEFREQIELNDGLTVRDFHKKYFSAHGEREVNEFFYDRGLLIDERNKRYNPETGQRKDGKNHRRPTFTGKAFFYLHGDLDRDGVRHEKTRVRPGAPELQLVEYMTKRGFTANRSESKELAHV